MLKSDWVRFLWEIHFCPNLGKKGPKIRYFAFCFFLKILSFIFPKNNANKNSAKSKSHDLILDFPSQTPCLAQFLFWNWNINSWPVRLQDSLKCNSVNELRNQVDFWLQINSRVSYKSVLLLLVVWPGMPKVPKITSLQYFKKEVKDKYDFLHEDKYQIFYKLVFYYWS